MGSKNSKKSYTIAMVGLDGAGKSSMIKYLESQDKKKKSEPSNPSNLPIKLINYKGVNLTIWNLSGKSEPLKSVIKDKVDALIFVVDSVDKDEFEDAAKKLETIIQEYNMEDFVVLLFANKQDLDGAASPNEVQEKLGMLKLK